MSKRETDNRSHDALGLDGFGEVPGDQGLSLEKLSESFARLLDQGEEPYRPEEAAVAGQTAGVSGRAEATAGEVCGDNDPADPNDASPKDDACPLTPRSVLEAMLFVGHPENEPLTSQEITALMRGVRPAEVDELIRQLNQTYLEEGCPYIVQSVGAGYRMTLRPQYHPLREKFYGKIRQARLSQAAIDVLAIVAYHQPIVRREVDRLRQRPSGAILRQLVRRGLLRIQRRQDPRRTADYFTTDRFLDLFGLESLEELPRSQELQPEV